MRDPFRLVIVGGVAGGASCAARARRLSEDAEIVIYERGPHVSFANCGLPYYVGGEIARRDSLLLQTASGLTRRFHLEVHTATEVLSIDRGSRLLEVRDLGSGEVRADRYDALVLSVGATPLKPPIPGIDRPGAFTVRNIPDVDQIVGWIQKQSARTAVVVGGGYIGLEMAEQLRRRGLEVAVAEALPQVMAPLDPEMAALLHEELRRNQVDLHLGDAVDFFDQPRGAENARASVVVLKSGARLPADVVILGLGVRPDLKLAREAGLKIGTTGGLKVDARLRTSDPHIWAVGDAIEVRNLATGTPSLIPLAGPANRQGRIAANVILGRPDRYEGTLGTAILRLFSLTAACTGASEKILKQLGRDYEAVHLHPHSHAGYFPGAERMALKVLFDPYSSKLLGAQAVGGSGVDKRIDVLATALRAGLTIHEVAELELAYAPSFGSAKDPVNLAGMAAQNIQARDVEVIHWDQLEGLDPERTALLDVRTQAERDRDGALPGSLHIPLDELRDRQDEVPPDREIVVHCASGQRSYYAARLLGQKGFRVRNLSGSFLTWKAAVGAGLAKLPQLVASAARQP